MRRMLCISRLLLPPLARALSEPSRSSDPLSESLSTLRRASSEFAVAGGLLLANPDFNDHPVAPGAAALTRWSP